MAKLKYQLIITSFDATDILTLQILAQKRGLDCQVTSLDSIREELKTTDEITKWNRLLHFANQNQVSILKFIKQNPDGVRMENIADHLKATNSQVTGMMNGGLMKNIRRAGFEHVEVVSKDFNNVYSPGELLLATDLI